MDRARSNWAARLQPIKELAQNFDIDIAAELEQYLDEVEQCIHGELSEHSTSFEEAALVVQGSSHAYAKKVDYLMKLAVAALEGAKAKQKQSDQAQKTKGADSDSATCLTRHDLLEEIATAGCASNTQDADSFAVLGLPEAQPALLASVSTISSFPTVAHLVGQERKDHAPQRKESTAATMSPSDAPTFNCMRCHWHCSGALLLLPDGGDLFDSNLDTRPDDRPLEAASLEPSTSGFHPAASAAAGEGSAAELPFGSPLIHVGDEPDEAATHAQSPAMWFGTDEPMNDLGEYEPADVPPEAPDAALPDALAVAEINAAAAAALANMPAWPPEAGAPPGGGAGAAEDEELDAVPDPYAEVDMFAPDPATSVKLHKTLVPKTPIFRTAMKVHHWRPFADSAVAAATQQRMALLVPQHAIATPDAAAAKRRSTTRRNTKRLSITAGPLAQPGPAFDEEKPAAEPAAPDSTGPLQADGDADVAAPAEGDALAVDPDDFGAGGDADDVFAFGDAEEGHDAAADGDEFSFGAGQNIDTMAGLNDGDDPLSLFGRGFGSQLEGSQLEESAMYQHLHERFADAVNAAFIANQSDSHLASRVKEWHEIIEAVMVEQDERPAFNIQTTSSILVERAVARSQKPRQALDLADVVHSAHRYEVSRMFTALLQSANDGTLAIEHSSGAPAAPFHIRLG